MRLLDTRTVALALGCTDRHVRNLVARGVLTNHGTPRRIRIDLDEVQEKIASNPV